MTTRADRARAPLGLAAALGVEDADALCGHAAASGAVVAGIDPVRSTLEDVFLRAVDDSASEASAGASAGVTDRREGAS